MRKNIIINILRAYSALLLHAASALLIMIHVLDASGTCEKGKPRAYRSLWTTRRPCHFAMPWCWMPLRRQRPAKPKPRVLGTFVPECRRLVPRGLYDPSRTLLRVRDPLSFVDDTLGAGDPVNSADPRNTRGWSAAHEDTRAGHFSLPSHFLLSLSLYSYRHSFGKSGQRKRK